MIQFDYSIAWEVASEIHCAEYGVEIAYQTFKKKENMASYGECFIFGTKGKKWEVYIKVHKATRWTIKTWFDATLV